MKNFIYIFIIPFILISCGGKDDPIPEKIVELGAFELVFPEKNTLCTEGTIISEDKVSIPLQWSVSKNATSYKVVVTNTNTGVKIEETTINNSLDVDLLKGEKFSWNVTAFVDNKTKLSNSTWNFYSEGASVDNHAPFPASISLVDNKDGTVNINWEATDLDNDIVNYKVYLGTSENTAVLIKEINDNKITNQKIDYNTEYFIKIVTIDKNGNSSSGIKLFKFRI